MPSNTFTGELGRPLHAQIPLELLSSCAQIGRRRLVFVYAWLWFYAGQSDTAFPSVPRLALECGMKERDIRSALAVLSQEGWIVRHGTGPKGTNIWRVRMETKRRRQRSKLVAAERDPAAPLPPRGRPSRGTTPPPQGESPQRAPLPPGGTPPGGDPINKPLNVEEENLEELITIPNINMSKRVENISATTPLVTTAGAVATVGQIVVTSTENDAPQRHDPPACPAPGAPVSDQAADQRPGLPACAQPYRQLLVEWWTRRRRKYPDLGALTPAELGAIHHADALGVLEPFLAQAAASGCKSLATGYLRRCEQLRAGPANSAAFEALRGAYLAAPRRVTCQTLPAAQRELAVVFAEGYSLDQLMTALAAELRAQEQQLASTGFAPSLPDLARWLKERRFVAYLPPSQSAATTDATTFVAPIDPESGAPDPFAFHRHITGQ